MNGGTIVENDTTTYNTGLSQALPWGGGNFAFQFNNNKQVTSNLFANYNPAFNSNFAANVHAAAAARLPDRRQPAAAAGHRHQPRHLGHPAARHARHDAGQRAQRLLGAGVRDAGRWTWPRARWTSPKSWSQDNRARVEVGTMAPLDVVQAEAEAATRRQALAQAEATLRTAELTLKRLIVNGTDDPLWRATITPVDRPTFRAEPLDVEARGPQGARRTAPTSTQARKTLESNDITLKFLHNQTLPALDADRRLRRRRPRRHAVSSAPGPASRSVITGTVPGGYGDAWRTMTGRDYPNWNVAVNCQLSDRRRARRMRSYARATMQRNQAAAQLRALELRSRPKSPTPRCRSRATSSATRPPPRRASWPRRGSNAEQSRFEVGLSTNFFVVQAQRDLATAQNSELRALLDYRTLARGFRARAAGARGRPRHHDYYRQRRTDSSVCRHGFIREDAVRFASS